MVIRWISPVAVLAMAAIIAVISLVGPPSSFPVTFGLLDKLGHLVVYLILAFFSYRWWSSRRGSARRGTARRGIARRRHRVARILATVVLCSLYGGALELLQRYFGRSPEVLDLLADVIGSAVGATASAVLDRRPRSEGR
jgi:VanZ family protein